MMYDKLAIKLKEIFIKRLRQSPRMRVCLFFCHFSLSRCQRRRGGRTPTLDLGMTRQEVCHYATFADIVSVNVKLQLELSTFTPCLLEMLSDKAKFIHISSLFLMHLILNKHSIDLCKREDKIN